MKPTTKELKQEAQELNDAIYNAECYGSHDLLRLNAILTELEKRGVEIETKTFIQFN